MNNHLHVVDYSYSYTHTTTHTNDITMKTVQMTLDDDLVDAVDEVARQQKTSRSEFKKQKETGTDQNGASLSIINPPSRWLSGVEAGRIAA